MFELTISYQEPGVPTSNSILVLRGDELEVVDRLIHGRGRSSSLYQRSFVLHGPFSTYEMFTLNSTRELRLVSVSNSQDKEDRRWDGMTLPDLICAHEINSTVATITLNQKVQV